MIDVARLMDGDRRDLFRETGRLMQVQEAIIEKDFWVCWILDYLFQASEWRDKLLFKGGTSLSKAYGVIQRFSEDIDLVIDWGLLGCAEQEVFLDRSRKKQTEFCDTISRKTIEWLRSDFIPIIRTELRERLGAELAIEQEGQIARIAYPQSFTTDYVRPEILLEIGPKALHEPNEMVAIRSYAAERFPELFKVSATTVRTVSAERTFWEKATILHQEAHRTAEKMLPLRYSRHYYDLYQLSMSSVLANALQQIDLLKEVTDFKIRFFRSGWARYEDAKPGTLRLRPSEHHMHALKRDYELMRAMLFGRIPEFEVMIQRLSSLESQINNLT